MTNLNIISNTTFPHQTESRRAQTIKEMATSNNPMEETEVAETTMMPTENGKDQPLVIDSTSSKPAAQAGASKAQVIPQEASCKPTLPTLCRLRTLGK